MCEEQDTSVTETDVFLEVYPQREEVELEADMGDTSRNFSKTFNVETCKAAATPRDKLDDDAVYNNINSTQLLDREG